MRLAKSQLKDIIKEVLDIVIREEATKVGALQDQRVAIAAAAKERIGH
jgi:hypothetical protein